VGGDLYGRGGQEKGSSHHQRSPGKLAKNNATISHSEEKIFSKLISRNPAVLRRIVEKKKVIEPSYSKKT